MLKKLNKWCKEHQHIIVLIGTLAAIYFGWQQTRINQQLYDLNFSFSVNAYLDTCDQKIYITNKGKDGIWLWGGISGGEKVISEKGKYIPPEETIFISAGIPALNLLKESNNYPLEFYFKNSIETQYVVQANILVVPADNQPKVMTQITSIEKKNWEKNKIFNYLSQ